MKVSKKPKTNFNLLSKGELSSIETDVASLISEMEASIREADAFIKEMG